MIMKIKKIIILVSSAILLSACDLDREPGGKIPTKNFFKTEHDVELALMGCYAKLDNTVYDAYTDGYADDNFCQYPWESNAAIISAGNINTDLNDGYDYMGIRRFNFFLEKVNDVKMDEKKKKQYIAEVKVLRALKFFNLTTKFGPIPFYTKYIDKSEDAAIAPTAEKEVLDFCIKELRAAVIDLPESPAVKSRIGKAAALAYLTRVALWQANWKEAAEASKHIMTMGYSLFKVNTVPQSILDDNYADFVTFKDAQEKESFCKGLYSYQSLFYDINSGNSEVILNQEFIPSEYNYMGLYLMADNYCGGWSSITPTVELVNSYWTRDGKKFIAPTKEVRAQRYNNGQYTPEYLNEFKNRDTRLYATILFPGVIWNEALKGKKYSWRKTGSNISKTGYNYRKMVDPENDMWHKVNDHPLIRYAEVLLSYAEAQNEIAGPDQSVYDAINEVRKRVDMPEVDKATAGSKDAMRELIRNERGIELANEGQRWNDVRRWKISKEVMVNTYAIDGDLTQKRNWDDKFVRLPYPQSAIDRNPNLKDAQKAKGY